MWFSIKVLNKYQNKNKTKKNTQTNKEKTKRQKQSKNNYTRSDFSGYSKCGKKIIVTFFSVTFFSTDGTHTYDIILNTDTLSILIPYSQ